MLKIFFFTNFLLISSLSLAGDWSSGGGDPVLVKAQPFPHKQVLEEAILMLKQKIAECPYHDAFKQAFLQELTLLENNNSFYYIPELFSVGLNRFPGDYEILVSNGAMTEYTRGAPIYFSKQSVNYDARTLARVIAQEIPHHLFTSSWGRNELFVNGLGTYLIVGGEPPTSPVHFGQVIYEEFVNRPGPVLDQMVTEARAGQRDDFRWHESIFRLASKTDRERGSYGTHRLGAMLESVSVFQARSKKSEITTDMELFRHSLKTCVFTTYEDGPSGITQNEQEVLSNMFINYLNELSRLKLTFYYVENVSMASEKEITSCALAIIGPADSVLMIQRIYAHPDDQHDQFGRPFRP